MKNTNFKAYQSLAKAATSRLIFLYCLAIFMTLACYSVATYFLVKALTKPPKSVVAYHVQSLSSELSHWNTITMSIMGVCSLCLIAILLGSYTTLLSNKKIGGIGIAQYLGGNLVKINQNPQTRRLVNIVEEMAIASGVIKPAILISADESINAFVTGFDGNYAITVSQGALDCLTREELQAVVAHEFGHILSKDVDLNMKLIALIAGFLTISSILSFWNWGRNSDNSSGSNIGNVNLGDVDKAAVFIIIFVVVVYIITSIMVALGRILQAAISRQREYLSDAYSVDFTRNSHALVNALKKVQAQQLVGEIDVSKVEQEYAHLFFSNFQSSMLNTHPSIMQRIKKYDGYYTDAELRMLNKNMKSQVQAEVQAQAEDGKARTQENRVLEFDHGMNVATVMPLVFAQVVVNQQLKSNYPANIAPSIWIYAIFCTLEEITLDEFQSMKLVPDYANFIKEEVFVSEFHKVCDYLRTENPTNWIKILEWQAKIFSRNSAQSKLELLQVVGQLIKFDAVLSSNELSYLLVLQAALNNVSSEVGSMHLEEYKNDVLLIFNALIHLGNVQKSSEVLINLIQTKGLKIQVEKFDLVTDWTSQLYLFSKKLKTLNANSKQQLLDILCEFSAAYNEITLQQFNLSTALLKLLK